MSLLIDENLSHRLPALIADIFPRAVHVRDVGLRSADDEDIWNYAATNGLTIVSQASDFRHRSFLRGAPPKVIWICLTNTATAHVEAVLRSQQAPIETFLNDPQIAI